jgi:polysaccharide pyruvyl transferase WcaK-like protein
MEITILGWYGTETIGDRAILAGILKLLYDSIGKYKVNLGSLYPFFSQRTLSEDNNFWKNILGLNIPVNIFDSKNIVELDKALLESDFVIMGGGPLMQIEQMYLLRYAFKKAKRLGKKTALLGCGVGPLYSRSYQSCLFDILENVDIAILRDAISLDQLKEINKLHKRNLKINITTSIDPSVLACLWFNKVTKPQPTKDYIAINLREFPINYSAPKTINEINEKLIKVVKVIIGLHSNSLIKLIPMHYFHFGNDDRVFLNSIGANLISNNLYIQNKPLNLYQTMEVFRNAKTCYGMRLHAVIFQTLLNGNNFILDYTEPLKGKISGFLKEIDLHGFYKKRYLNLQTEKDKYGLLSTGANKFTVPMKEINEKLDRYRKGIKELF